MQEIQVEKRFHYIRKLEKRQKNSKRGNIETDPVELEHFRREAAMSAEASQGEGHTGYYN
jgi:hypothetical protein